MRTTLDIDDDLLATAKELARTSGTSTGRVVSDLLRRALCAGEQQPRATTVAEPAARYGFRPFPADGTVVTNDVIDTLRDEEGV